MQKLKDMFKKVVYGDDTRSLSKNIREWLQGRGIKATVERNSLGVRHEGPRVSGEHRGAIELFITVDKPFHLNQFVEEYLECEFLCIVPDRIFPMPYTISIKINGEDLFDFGGGLRLNSKFREGALTEGMFWSKIFEGKAYGETYKEYLVGPDKVFDLKVATNKIPETKRKSSMKVIVDLKNVNNADGIISPIAHLDGKEIEVMTEDDMINWAGDNEDRNFLHSCIDWDAYSYVIPINDSDCYSFKKEWVEEPIFGLKDAVDEVNKLTQNTQGPKL